MLHTVIVPGVGGSDENHWQSWLQRKLSNCSRVEQANWNEPILSDWINKLYQTTAMINEPIQIVAHSFGCLASIAALSQNIDFRKKVKHLTLVAPANPIRFGEMGFSQTDSNYANYFHSVSLIDISTSLLISENDPWLAFEDALLLAKAWKIEPINLGKVGHINVESGFGAFPTIFNYLCQSEHHDNLIADKDRKMGCRYIN